MSGRQFKAKLAKQCKAWIKLLFVFSRRNPTSVTNASEIRVENRDLLCDHEKFHYPLALIKEIQAGQGTTENM